MGCCGVVADDDDEVVCGTSVCSNDLADEDDEEDTVWSDAMVFWLPAGESVRSAGSLLGTEGTFLGGGMRPIAPSWPVDGRSAVSELEKSCGMPAHPKYGCSNGT